MVVTTGFFDGVHTGHRVVIQRLVCEARNRGQKSLVITFWPHPRTVLQNGARELRLLNSLEEKKQLLYALGVDQVQVLDFDREFSRLTAEQYLRDYVKGRFGGKTVLLGYNHRMGCDAQGADELRATASAIGLETIMVEKAPGNVSSTIIRKALEEGDVKGAADMLGYRYSLTGVVVAGNRLGRTIGFPTANLKLYDPLKMVPRNGVYAVEAQVLGCTYKGMCNIGVRPTVGVGSAPSIETNIFDFDQDIYGLDLKVTFKEKIRDEQKFPSLQALAGQLAKDKDIAKIK
ncbi:MAG: riboflavin biosynthesis protein RibF [Bacteroidales bacterium]|nr:riboflavin biosynthesis protein RibF [Bacteroidales bacterium]